MALFTDTEENLKQVASAQNIMADLAIEDPKMTRAILPGVTAATGIDAFIHAVQSYVNSKNSNAFTDTIALEAIKLVAERLWPAFANGNDTSAQYNMALGSLMSGITLNNAGVGHVHALAYPIGTEYHFSRGLTLIVIFAECMRSIAMANLAKLRKIAEVIGPNVSDLSPWDAAEA